MDNTTVFHLQDDKQQNNRNEVGGSFGGPILKDRLFFFGSVSPRFVRRENNYLFNNGVEPGSLNQKQTLTQAFGKVTYTTNRMVANGNILLTPTRSTGTLASYRGTGTNFTTSSAAQNEPFRTQGFDVNQTNAGGDVNFFLTSSSFLSVRGGYFKDEYKDIGISNVTSYTYQTTAVGLPFAIPANLQQPRLTSNTPRTQINVFDDTTRGFFNVDYNHTFNAVGTHQLKGGAGFQRSTNGVENSYPGGYVYIYWNSTLTGAQGQRGTGTYGYYRVDDFATRGTVGANIIPLYVQDTWTPTPRVTLNLGLRTENEKVPSFRPDIQQNAFEFGFGEKLAPRLGASYDVRGDGKLKVSGSWGRYFDWTKYSISRGSYGGDIWHIFYRSLDTTDIGTLNLSNMPGRDLWGSSTGFRDLRATNFENTDVNTKPMFRPARPSAWSEVSPTTVLTLNPSQQPDRTIEDSALIDGNNVSIGNPGEGIAVLCGGRFPMRAVTA